MTTYADIRGGIRDGDIAFFSGDTLLARAIQRVTESKINHCGMLFWEQADEGDEDNLLMLHEAVDVGCRVIRFSEKLCASTKPVIIARSRYVDSEARRAAIRRQSHYDLAVRYNKWALLQIYTRIRLGIGRKPQWDSKKGLICSEFCARAYAKAGYAFKSRYPGFTSPHDLYADPHMTMIASIEPQCELEYNGGLL